MCGRGEVESAITLRLRETRPVLDVMDVFIAELLNARDDRTDGRVSQSAERLPADVVRHVEQQVGILRPSLASFEAVEDRLHPVRSLAARSALTARLVREELRQTPDGVDDADALVEDDDAGGAEHRSGLHHS